MCFSLIFVRIENKWAIANGLLKYNSCCAKLLFISITHCCVNDNK